MKQQTIIIYHKPDQGNFTIGKSYKVLDIELVTSATVEYLVNDDDGNQRWVYSAYCNPNLRNPKYP